MAAPPSDAAFRRSRAISVAVAAALTVAGVLIAVLVDEDGEIYGGFLLGVAAILAIARVFYEIGIGEDRERAKGRS